MFDSLLKTHKHSELISSSSPKILFPLYLSHLNKWYLCSPSWLIQKPECRFWQFSFFHFLSPIHHQILYLLKYTLILLPIFTIFSPKPSVLTGLFSSILPFPLHCPHTILVSVTPLLNLPLKKVHMFYHCFKGPCDEAPVDPCSSI